MAGNKRKLITYLLDQDNDAIFDLKIHKEKRNLNQNAMYWKLLNELAMKLNLSTEETHKQILKDYSVRYEILVPEETELRGIEYYEWKSKIIKNGKVFIVYHVFTPSHELKTDEFSHLLSGLVQECENVGIEVEL